MKAEDTSFLTLIGSGQRQFIIPVFQRDYSWTEAQCAQLLVDVQRVASRPYGGTHFVGSVVCVASSDQSAVLPQWVVIDGQQRPLPDLVENPHRRLAGIGRAQRLLQAPCNNLQHLVTYIVAKRIVDRLKPVQIDEQQCEWAVISRGKCLAKLVLEEPAIV